MQQGAWTWADAERIFDEALGCEAADRGRFVAEKCRDRPGLLEEVQSLLAHADLSLPGFVEHVEVGDVIGGRYELLSPLGEGGSSLVFAARDSKKRRFVALKILKPDLFHVLGLHERMAREARAARSLLHPACVRVLDDGEHRGLPYLVMDHVEGVPLSNLLARGPLPVQDALAVLADVLDALDHAHRRGIVHRDVKPGNVIVTPSGRARVTDFGVAKILQAGPLARSITKTGDLVGTVAYMSPEQAAGSTVDARSDLFSVGVTAYHMLAGRRPFDGPLSEVVVKIRKDPLPPAPEMPPALEGWVARACEKEPGKRYPSAAAMKRALVRAAWPMTIPRQSRDVFGGIVALASGAALAGLVATVGIAVAVLGVHGRWSTTPIGAGTSVPPGWYVEAAAARGCHNAETMRRIHGHLEKGRVFFGRPHWEADAAGRMQVRSIEVLDAPGNWLTAIYLGPLDTSLEAGTAIAEVEAAARLEPGPTCLSTTLRRIP